MIKNFKALLFGLTVALILCEVILRIYNPFTNFSRQGKLILPANQKTVFHNKWIRQLDSQIYYSRNALGFRGALPPDSIHKISSLICIGGSTTECRFLSDDQTWPYLLQQQLKDTVPQLWINNAGIDGHSTFGHLLLLKEYIIKLKPRYVMLLTGVNDLETEKPETFDMMNENNINFHSVKSFFKSVINKTEIGATVFQLYAIKLAYKKGLIHKELDFKTLPDTLLSTSFQQQKLSTQQHFVKGYKERLQQIATICLENGVQPVFLTQPSLHGAYTDPATGVRMDNKYLPSTVPVSNNALQQKVLDEYNRAILSLRPQVTVIHLDSLMPKSTAYYYDFIHFNKAGAQKVAQLLAVELNRQLFKTGAN
jgi:lysophospholipase L1-like esterase